LRTRAELYHVHANSTPDTDFTARLYEPDQEGSYGLEGVVREALAAPWSSTWQGSHASHAPLQNPRTYATLAQLDRLEGADALLGATPAIFADLLRKCWREFDTITPEHPAPGAVVALTALADLVDGLGYDPELLAFARERIEQIQTSFVATTPLAAYATLARLVRTTRQLLVDTPGRPIREDVIST
jgi:hypothetical protein